MYFCSLFRVANYFEPHEVKVNRLSIMSPFKISRDTDRSAHTLDDLKKKAEGILEQLTKLQEEVIAKLADYRETLPAKIEEYTSHDNTADVLYYLYLRSLYAFPFRISQLIVSGFSDLDDLIKNEGPNCDAYEEKEHYMATLEKIIPMISLMNRSLIEGFLVRLNHLKNELDLYDFMNVTKDCEGGGYSFLDILGSIREAGITYDLIQRVIDDVMPTSPNIETLK